MRKLFIFIAFFSFTALASYAQEHVITGQSDIVLIDDMHGEVDLEIDLTDKVLAAISKNGRQLIATVKGINLYADVQDGKVIKYVAFKSRGKEITVAQTKALKSCQLCVADQQAGTICWSVACNQIP